MLRFFRHIRKKFIEQDNVRKYLLYAIGEIALVMIGILLALQVNNWNETRKVNHERIALINALKTDYELTAITIEEQLTNSENRTKNLKKLLSYSAGEGIDISDDSLKTMLQESLRFEFFQNFSTTYEQAKSSGKLSLIRNENLLKALSRNENNIEGLKSVDIPLSKEYFITFNANIEIINMFDRLANLDMTPAKHPEIFLKGQKLHKFVRSPDTYTKLYQIYLLNNLMYLWCASIRTSTDVVLDEINVSLNLK